MKKILLTILLLLNMVYANKSYEDEKTLKIGTVKYSNLDNNIKTFYLGLQRERRQDIFLVDYTQLDLRNNNIKKDGNVFNVSYIFKLAYENEIIFGPKFSYIRYDFDNYSDDYVKIGLYSGYNISDNFRLYGNLVLNDTLKKRKEKELNNIDFGIDYKNNDITYSINIETSLSINIHDSRFFASDEYEKILFSIGFNY